MKELLRSNNPVELSWAAAVLAEAGIESQLLDQHASIMEGSLVAIERRLMVANEEATRALWVLEAARRALDEA